MMGLFLFLAERSDGRADTFQALCLLVPLAFLTWIVVKWCESEIPYLRYRALRDQRTRVPPRQG